MRCEQSTRSVDSGWMMGRSGVDVVPAELRSASASPESGTTLQLTARYMYTCTKKRTSCNMDHCCSIEYLNRLNKIDQHGNTDEDYAIVTMPPVAVLQPSSTDPNRPISPSRRAFFSQHSRALYCESLFTSQNVTGTLTTSQKLTPKYSPQSSQNPE